MEEKQAKLKELVDLFNYNFDQYKSASYDEANTRTDFIDKFFRLLGWDVSNEQGFAEMYREVVREDTVRIAGKPKAPDYSFRVGGNRKFFVEAKKPRVNIKDDVAPAFQLRRYAYTAKLPLSILTDFEEFAVYDTRIKPDPKDKSAVGRVFYCRFEDYRENFEFIYNTFSKQAIQKGSFDRYVEENKNKKGTSEVDKEFLKLIEAWRDNLARNLALRNDDLDVFSLNQAIQKIIDRVIFLRIAEDRNIEEYGHLGKLAKEADIYEKLKKLFAKADKKYNSGLFEKQTWLEELKIDDKILADIFKNLYYPNCPYEFSVMPVEILGQIYEQFLGKTIRLTPSHQAKIEEKPQVRKAGGVYYTPQYIVDYIVKNTVGELLKKKPVKYFDDPQNNTLKILDPACGSGSFLLGAFNYLLDFYLSFYSDPKRASKYQKKGFIYEVGENEYRLTTLTKQQLLLGNIFGVDIDAQAVEVTKLSLFLKLLEGENKETSGRLFKDTDWKMLPDLRENIKCGNSLIGPDFYEQGALLDDEGMRKVNVFDWQKEFGEILQGRGGLSAEASAKAGFDCVIGNPPWGQKAVIFTTQERAYLKEKYPNSSFGILDLFRFFIEKSINITRESGFWGQVLPDVVLLKNYPGTRKFVLDELSIDKIDHWGMAFEGVNLEACTITGFKEDLKNNEIRVSIHEKDTITTRKVPQEAFEKLEGYKFNLFLNEEKISILDKLSDLPRFGEFFDCHEGIHSGNIRKKLFVESENNENCRKLILGRDEVQRYFLNWGGLWVDYSKDIINKARKEYAGLGKREYFENEKIVVRRTGDYVLANFDDKGYYFSNNVFVCSLRKNGNPKFFLGILNSHLVTWYYQTIQPRKGKLFSELKLNVLSKFPIPKATPEQQKPLIDLVDQMLETQKKLHEAKAEHDQKFYQQKAEILDKKIDNLVFDLYGLSEEEREVILEGGGGR